MARPKASLYHPGMRLVLVTASVPPEICGIGDYTLRLRSALRELGIDVEVYHRPKWSWATRHDALAEIEALGPDLLHVQYPGVGFGKGFTPSWLVWRFRRAPAIVTVHEYHAIYSHPPWYPLPRGLRNFGPFVTRARALVFSNGQELDRVAAWAPWIRRRSEVIPIGSTIPRGSEPEERAAEVVYFGQIAPGKGLEAFLELAEARDAEREAWRCVLVGGVPRVFHGYAEPVLARAERAGVEIFRDAPSEAVAARLARARYAYLPFPDGATEKRTSLLAALNNGLIVLTPHGKSTPRWLRECTVPVDSPEEGRRALAGLEEHPESRERLRRAADQQRERFSWTTIARRHATLYQRTLGAFPSGRRA